MNFRKLSAFGDTQIVYQNKTEKIDETQEFAFASFSFPEQIKNFHTDRAYEFKLGRWCAAAAYNEVTKKNLTALPINSDRTPAWPDDVIGSITHNKKYVLAVVELSSKAIGIGVDIELLGSVGKHLQSKITASGDLTFHSEIPDEKLLTYIFSIKESVYKAMYPTVKEFFDFQSVVVHEIRTQDQTFVVEIDSEITQKFLAKVNSLKNVELSVEKKLLITGRYTVLDGEHLVSLVVLG